MPPDWHGHWHRLAGVFDGDQLRLYLDHKLAGSAECSRPLLATAHSLTIGSDPEHPEWPAAARDLVARWRTA